MANLTWVRAVMGILVCVAVLNATAQKGSVTIPLGGNAWRNTAHGSVAGDSAAGFIDNNGVGGWTDSVVFFDVWLRTALPGTLRVWIVGDVPHGKSRIRVDMGDRTFTPELQGRGLHSYEAGTFVLRDTGYQRIRLRAVSR